MAAPRTEILASLALIAVLASADGALAQHVHQPYAGQQDRAIKALDAGRIEGLRNGAGLGYAKAAELSGWPGPLHVLELADQLDLSPDQVAAMEQLRADMLAQAQPLGLQLIEAERALEALFTSSDADPQAVAAATAQAARIEGRLRAVHLQAHLKTKPVLSSHQLTRYADLRGYIGTAAHGEHQH